MSGLDFFGNTGEHYDGPVPPPDDADAARFLDLRPTAGLPFAVTTADLLREQLPDPPPPRIVGVLPGRGGAVLIAQAGAGKTTMLANLARDLLEGTPFLERQAVRQVGGRIALLSYEMDGAELIDWCASAGVDLTRLVVLDLRDVPNPLRDPFEREVLGGLLDKLEVEVVMVDTFGRAFTGDSQDSASEVTAWFAMLNHFTRTLAGAKEWIVAAHAGWTDGRGRGSSALHDAPDAVLIYKRDRDSDTRTLRADKFRGRDPLAEVTVTMDPTTLQLSAGALATTQTSAVRDYIRDNPGCSQSAIVRGVGIRERTVAATASALVVSGEVVRERGARGAYCYSLAQSASPETLGGAELLNQSTASPPLYRGGGGGSGDELTGGAQPDTATPLPQEVAS